MAAKHTKPTKKKAPAGQKVNASVKAWKSITWITSFLVAISGLFSYFPLLTIDAGTPLDPSDFATYPFSVTNDGPLPLFHVTTTCTLYRAVTREGTLINDVGYDGSGESVLTLYPHQKTTPNCFAAMHFHTSLQSGMEEVTASYYTFLWPFRGHTSRHFRAVLNSEGHTVFLPQ